MQEGRRAAGRGDIGERMPGEGLPAHDGEDPDHGGDDRGHAADDECHVHRLAGEESRLERPSASRSAHLELGTGPGVAAVAG